MLSKGDGQFVAQAALDAIAAAGEMIVDDRAKLVGVQITLVVSTPERTRMVGVTKERRA